MIEYKATKVAHTPSGDVNCCDKHLSQLINIFSVLGCHIVGSELPEDINATCRNCVNEGRLNEPKKTNINRASNTMPDSR